MLSPARATSQLSKGDPNQWAGNVIVTECGGGENNTSFFMLFVHQSCFCEVSRQFSTLASKQSDIKHEMLARNKIPHWHQCRTAIGGAGN